MQFMRDLSRIPILVQGYARLLTTTSRSLRRMVFKPTEGQRRAVFDSRVLVLDSWSVSLIFLLGL